MPTIKHRYATQAVWLETNPVLAAGELGVEFGVMGAPDRFKIGNGLSTWAQLGYFVNEMEFDPDLGRLSEASLDARYSRNFGEFTMASMGDSLTEEQHNIGTPPVVNRRAWADLGVLLSGSRVRYIGDAATGGMDIQAIRATHLPTILTRRPTYCTVLAGQNSLTGFDQSDINDLIFMYQAMMGAGITPILIGNPPTNVGVEQDRLNNFVKSFALANGLPYFDMAEALVEPSTGLYKTGMSTDGIHPTTPLAIATIARAFAVFLNKILPAKAQVPSYLLPQASTDGLPTNSFFAPQSGNANMPDLWALVQTCTTSLTQTAFGRKFRLTKLNGSRGQVNGPMQQLIAGREYYFTCRIEASVEAFGGSWTLSLLDIGNNYGNLVAFENQTTDVPADTVLAIRYKVPETASFPDNIGIVLPVMQVYGAGPYEEVGAPGSTVAISQMINRPIETAI